MSAVSEADLMQAIINVLEKAGHSGKMLTVVIAGLVLLSVLTISGRWHVFAARDKWTGRIIFAIAVALVSLPMLAVQGVVWNHVPVQVRFETNDQTADAIKLGIYRLYVQREIVQGLTPEQAATVTCVYALGLRRAHEFYQHCPPEGCAALPPMARDDVAAAVKQLRVGLVKDADQATAKSCATVDIDRL